MMRRRGIMADPISSRPVPREHLMSILYRDTIPFDKRSHRASKETDERTLNLLEELTQAVERYVELLSKRPGRVHSTDDLGYSDLSALLEPFLAAVRNTRRWLPYLRRPYVREPDKLDQSVGLLRQLQNRTGITELEAVDLVRVAFLAHGCSEDDVKVFTTSSVRAGTIRRRIQSRSQRLIRLVEKLASERKRKN